MIKTVRVIGDIHGRTNWRQLVEPFNEEIMYVFVGDYTDPYYGWEQVTYEQLVEVEEIGERIAASVIEFFANETNRELVENLRNAGLRFEVCQEAAVAVSDKLKGLSIVVSGVFSLHSRDEYKRLIEDNGGKNVGSVSKSTSFILAGENMGPSKLEKAKKLGVRIVDEEEFLAML